MSSRITINSNLASLNAERRFGKSTQNLQESFNRLSSGLRINRARDDASGLAISSQLSADARVFNQGIRNFNDAISLLNIAEGAAQELSSILIRQRELASQAANGTLSITQRLALNEEANALKDEYNRIVESTEFNNLSLLDAQLGTVKAQGGYGENGSISFALAEELSRAVGDGTFEAATNVGTGTQPHDIEVGDLNGDGIADLALGERSGANVAVLIGNGDGTFKGQIDLSTQGFNLDTKLVDVDNDGDLDIIAGANTVNVFISRGDGTFEARADYEAAFGASHIDLGDVNGDGVVDVVAGSFSQSSIRVLLGNGDGSFRAGETFASFASSFGLSLADYNNDGFEDVVRVINSDEVLLHRGNGDGSFTAAITLDISGYGFDTIAVADFNHDGNVDLAMGDFDNDQLHIALGNGDGTFDFSRSFSAPGGPGGSPDLGDLNGDGFTDIVLGAETGDQALVYLGNGDGSFKAATSAATGGAPYATRFGDVDGDGALDVVSSNFSGGNISVLISNTNRISTIGQLNLTTADAARDEMEIIDAALERVASELGTIGAAQSRLSTAVSNLQQGRENYVAAASQITDIDVAEESANLVRNQILQQAGAAVLSQANQSPQLALILLNGVG